MHHLGDLFVAKLLNFAQYEGGSKLGRKHREQFFDQYAIFYVAALVGLGRIELNELGPLESQSIHAEAHADSIEIARERTIFAKLADFSEGLQKGFLSDILGLVTISQQIGGSTY
jgi:hypothetical protein